jgi:hypothetical protein
MYHTEIDKILEVEITQNKIFSGKKFWIFFFKKKISGKKYWIFFFKIDYGNLVT